MAEDKLKESIDVAEWPLLRQHAERDVVILVAARMDLAEVGRAVADDDTTRVQAWIDQGVIGKPSTQQLETWNAAPDTRFSVLILRPYVFIQEKED